MSSDILPQQRVDEIDAPSEQLALPQLVREFLEPLASLKLTVALMAAAIFLILAGTVAQIDKDIWQVMGEYFRTPIARIDVRIFFPRAWNVPDKAIWFPGGFLIGGAMLVNLLAAHFLRFKVQARGARLFAGLSVTAAGAAMTWAVIASGSNPGGLQDLPLFEWSSLWLVLKLTLVGVWLAIIAALLKLEAGRSIERVGLSIAAVLLGGLLAWLWLLRSDFALGDSSLRILWQLLKGLFAALILLGGCILLFRKRAGIVLLHGGIALMMINELVVYQLHTEGLMQIKEGETVNYAQDIRTVELAVIDPSDPQEDDVVAIPLSRLKSRQTIRDADLPFDIEVVRFFQNSSLREAKSDEENLADAGTGLKFVADSVRPGSGTDTNSKVDMSSAYIRLLDKRHDDKLLGTYLVGVLQSLRGLPELISVDGKTYEVSLRFKRDYKSYSMHLIDGRFDKYMGTDKPSNYSSDLRLVDPTRHVDRKVHIWMNNPLRYAGETFYQSQMEVDPTTGREFTGLSVVVNAGWMIPYVACMIVAVGMLAQFSIVLVRFLNRRQAADRVVVAPQRGKTPKAVVAAPGSAWDWIAPLTVVSLAAVYVMAAVWPHVPPSGTMNLSAFGRLPVVFEGRMKPFDTLARNSLRVISDSETYTDSDGKRQPAIKWLLEVIADPIAAASEKVVRIQNLEVLDMFGLSRRSGFRYSIKELLPGKPEFDKQVAAGRETEAAARSVFQVKTLELANRLAAYSTLIAAFEQPQIREDHVAEDLVAAVRRQRDEAFARASMPLAIPSSESGDWQPFSVAWTKAYAQSVVLQQEPSQAVIDFYKIVVAFAQDNTEAFNTAVTGYQTWLTNHAPVEIDTRKLDFEAAFNRVGLFAMCSFFYVCAFILAALGWLGFTRPLNRAAFALIAFTFLLHTIALVSRIYISGRPPVTNLYSVAIFVGWGGVLLGLVLEGVYRLGVGNIIAAVAGFSTLLIAYVLAADGGDTFIVLQAVLDTQFWLATHVTCITFGYATTFVAGLLGMLYILGGVLTPSLTGEIRTALPRMIYGIVCFSIFFSFVGTVLGGLWADDSWGRFWGWDPKENGALIIVLWNALVLHARWGGMVRDRGLAALTVLGTIAVAWSAFGVNQLSVGLHNYGHTDGVTLTLIVFALSQLAIVGLALVPPRFVAQPARDGRLVQVWEMPRRRRGFEQAG